MRAETLDRLRAARASGTPVALLTRLPDGAQILLPGDDAPPELADAAREALDSDRAATVALGEARWFVHPHNPPLRLILVGAVHIAQALVPMAAAAGFAVTVVDPRRAFATEERFAPRSGPEDAVPTGAAPGGAVLVDEWPDDALAALRPDARTAIVTLTHDPKLDDPALDAALRSPAYYVGALGSRRTHAKRVARLVELGHAEAAIARIRAPVGLDIAAVTAPEIALSILAEIVATRRGAALARRAPA